jgi:hypothetical protein
MSLNRRGLAVLGAMALMAPLFAAGFPDRSARAQEASTSETFYVNAETGDDGNPGTKGKPLKTIPEAARRVSKGQGSGPTTAIIAEGLYGLDETALFRPQRRYAKNARLTIRAEALPDDPDWTPARMPVLVSTMPLSKTWMGRPDPFGGVSYGLQIETSHATVQGLRILGSPVHEHPNPKAVRATIPSCARGGASTTS